MPTAHRSPMRAHNPGRRPCRCCRVRGGTPQPAWHEIDVVEPAESRHGVIVEAPLSVIGGGDLRRRVREDGRRGVVVDGVRTGKGGHHHAAHAQRLGVGLGSVASDSLGVCLERGQCREQGYESFHVAKIVKCGTEANPVRRNLPVCRKRRCDARRAAKKMQVAQAVQAITAHAALSCRDCWRRFGLEKKNFDGILSENKSALPGEPGGRFHFQTTP